MGVDVRGKAKISVRTQETPFGTAKINSRWRRDRYYLVVTGPAAAVEWMFPGEACSMVDDITARREFSPAPWPITVVRTLRQVCAKWEEQWFERLEDHRELESCHGEPSNQPLAIQTFGQLTTTYLTVRRQELASGTLERNRHYGNRLLGCLGAETRLMNLDEFRLIRARDGLAKELKPATVNAIFGFLKTLLRWAEARGIQVNSGFKLIKSLKVVRNNHERAWWTTREVEIALQAAAKVDAAALESAQCSARRRCGDVVSDPGTAQLLIGLGCLLGLRWEEMVMLRWQDLDLDGIDAVSSAPAPVAHIVPKDGWVPKDAESRSIPIHQRLNEILLAYRRHLGWVLVPQKRMPKRGGTKRVYRYNPQKVWRQVLKVAMEMGAKQITPHGMRHSFASNLLMAGVSDVLVARWMGHADTAMIHQHYGHLLAYHGDINRMPISG